MIVGTTGRILDLMNRKLIGGREGGDAIKLFVMHEADELLSRGLSLYIMNFYQTHIILLFFFFFFFLGFKEQIYDIFCWLGVGVQVVLTSETRPMELKEMMEVLF